MIDKARVSKLVGMLASDYEGERANAAAMLTKMAKSAGVSLNELFQQAYGSSQPSIQPIPGTGSPSNPVSPRQPSRRTSEPRKTGVKRWTLAEKLDFLFSLNTLNEWERDFINTISVRHKDGSQLSARQRNVIAEMWKKYKP